MINKIEKEILDGIKYVPSEHADRLSASEVSSDLLELYLKRKHKVVDTEINQASIGSLLHLGLEHILKDKYSAEESVSKLIPNTTYHATATCDIIDYENKIIIDWKTTKLYTAKMIRKAIKDQDPFSNGYILQMNHQNYILGGGYKLYLGLFYKDAKVDMKTGKIDKSFELLQVPVINEKLYVDYIAKKALELDVYVKNDTVPKKCTDLWQRKIAGRTVNAKCEFYCSVSSFCKYKKDDPLIETAQW